SSAHAGLHSLSLHDALPIYWTKSLGDFWASKVTRLSAAEDRKTVRREEYELYKINLGFAASFKTPPSRFSNQYGTESIYKAYFRSEEHTSELQSREKLVCRL